MKTSILFLFLFAGLMTGAYLTTNQTPGAALVLASAFAAGLMLWTFRQYDRQFHALILPRPLRLPLRTTRQDPPAPPQRLAA